MVILSVKGVSLSQKVGREEGREGGRNFYGTQELGKPSKLQNGGNCASAARAGGRARLSVTQRRHSPGRAPGPSARQHFPKDLHTALQNLEGGEDPGAGHTCDFQRNRREMRNTGWLEAPWTGPEGRPLSALSEGGGGWPAFHGKRACSPLSCPLEQCAK